MFNQATLLSQLCIQGSSFPFKHVSSGFLSLVPVVLRRKSRNKEFK